MLVVVLLLSSAATPARAGIFSRLKRLHRCRRRIRTANLVHHVEKKLEHHVDKAFDKLEPRVDTVTSKRDCRQGQRPTRPSRGRAAST